MDFLPSHPSHGLHKPNYNNDQILLLKEAWSETYINEKPWFSLYKNMKPLKLKATFNKTLISK